MSPMWKAAWKMLAQVLALACLLGVATVSSVSTATAQSASNTVKARESYGRGQQLFRQGDFAGAKIAFNAAYDAVPNPIVLLSIAECEVRTEQFADAVKTLNRYLTERPTAPDRAQVEAQVAKLREKPGFVSVASTPSGAEIYVDGVHSGRLTPTELSLGAGDHTVAVQMPGYTRAERTVTVDIGSRQSLEILLDAVQVAEPTPPPTTEPVAETSSPSSRNTTAIWVASGIAGAGLVTGAILGGVALKNKDEFDKAPTEAKADKGERLALFADVGFGIAVAGAVTALVLYLTASDETAETQAFHVAPSVARTEAGLVGNLRF